MHFYATPLQVIIFSILRWADNELNVFLIGQSIRSSYSPFQSNNQFKVYHHQFDQLN